MIKQLKFPEPGNCFLINSQKLVYWELGPYSGLNLAPPYLLCSCHFTSSLYLAGKGRAIVSGRVQPVIDILDTLSLESAAVIALDLPIYLWGEGLPCYSSYCFH